MQIGEFARRAGVSTSKVRFYEDRGLLPSATRQANGYRSYGAADLRIIGFINDARMLGFTLSDIARFMERPAAERRDKRPLVQALKAKLVAVDQHLIEVDQQRKRVLALLSRLERDEE